MTGPILTRGEGGPPLAGALGKSNRCFEADSNSAKPKTYVLEMFPYPSGAHPHGARPAITRWGDCDRPAYRRNAGSRKCSIRWAGTHSGCRPRNAAMERKVHPGEWTPGEHRHHAVDQLKADRLSRSTGRSRARHLRPRILRPRAGACSSTCSTPAWSIARKSEVNWGPGRP